MDLIALSSRFVLAILFMVAGSLKLAQRADFRTTVLSYQILPSILSKALGIALPPIELVCGFLLAVGAQTRLVALVLAGMLGIFSLAIAINLIRGREIDCGCFSRSTSSSITWWTVGRNGLLLILALAVVGRSPNALSVDGALGGGHSALNNRDAVAACLIATVLVLGLGIAREAVLLRQKLKSTARLGAA